MKPRILFIAGGHDPFSPGEQGSLIAPELRAEFEVGVASCFPDPASSVIDTTGRDGLRKPRRLNWGAAAWELWRRLRAHRYDLVYSWDDVAARLLQRVSRVCPPSVRRWKWVAHSDDAAARVRRRGDFVPGARQVDWRTGDPGPAVLSQAQEGFTIVPWAVPAPLRRDDELRRRFGFEQDFKLIGAVCSLEARSGVKHLIWILDQIKCVRSDLRLILWGTGSMSAAIHRYAQQVGVADWIRWLRPSGGMRREMSSLDIYWHVPRENAFPGAAAFALLQGIPVIATRTPQTRALSAAWGTLITEASWGARDEFARQTHQRLLAPNIPAVPDTALAWIAEHDVSTVAEQHAAVCRHLLR